MKIWGARLEYIQFIAFILIYHAFLWGVSWNQINTSSLPELIHPTFIFDFLFVIFHLIIFRKKLLPLLLFQGEIKKLGIRLGTVALLALAINFIFRFYQVETPFHLLENPFLNLVILGPISEELIYRLVAFCYLIRLSPTWAVNLSSIIFALSHAPAFWLLDLDYYPFIIAQVFYCFIIGRILFKMMTDFSSIGAAILGHIVFNLVFYFYV